MSLDSDPYARMPMSRQTSPPAPASASCRSPARRSAAPPAAIGGPSRPTDHHQRPPLDALAGALVAVLLALALAAIMTMFPPGGLALAFASGGAMTAGITITPALRAAASLVGALSGLVLAQAADGGSS